MNADDERDRAPDDERAEEPGAVASGAAAEAREEAAPRRRSAVETLPDGSVVVPLLEEELVVSVRRVVRERVVVRKRVETREEQVEVDLARERLEFEGGEQVEVAGDVARPAPGVREAPDEPLRALLTVDDIPNLRNIPVVTADGHELGRVGDVDYDEGTRRIHSVGVAADTVGFRRVHVPVEDAVLTADALRLPHTRAELEHESRSPRDPADPAEAPGEAPAESASGADELLRHEEELRLGTLPTEVGAVRARKYVESEAAQRVVPRQIEHFDDVERRAPDEHDAGEIEVLGDGSVSIPVIEEELVVEKRPVIRERVLIRKELEGERYRVEARLRREHVAVEGDEAPDARTA